MHLHFSLDLKTDPKTRVLIARDPKHVLVYVT